MEEQKKEFTGVWIPKHIIEDEDLSWTEIILYSEIASFKICFKNNESLAKKLRLKNKESVSPLLTNLKNKGYIEEINNDGRKKYWKAILEQTYEKSKTRDKKNLIPPITNSLDIDNSIENNKDILSSEILKQNSDDAKTSLYDNLPMVNSITTNENLKKISTNEQKDKQINLDTTAIIDYWSTKWQEVWQQKPIIEWAKYKKLAKPIVEKLGLEKLKQICDVYFITDNHIFKEQKWSFQIMFSNVFLNQLITNL